MENCGRNKSVFRPIIELLIMAGEFWLMMRYINYLLLMGMVFSAFNTLFFKLHPFKIVLANLIMWLLLYYLTGDPKPVESLSTFGKCALYVAFPLFLFYYATDFE